MDQKTIDTYNQLAKEYDEETATFWERFPRTIVDTFIANVKGKVLDVGSGPGRDGLILKEAGLDVICLDAAEEMVKMSKARGLESVVGNFEALPFADKTFDGVWAYTALLHVPKAQVQKSINEIRRALKDNGILGLGMIEGTTELYRESSGMNQTRWFSFYTKEALEKLLHDNRFEILYFGKFNSADEKHPKGKNYLNFVARKL